MHPVFILLTAVAILLVSILAFRLHAFLALMLAALVVAMLTPKPAVERFEIEKRAVRPQPAEGAGWHLNVTPRQGARLGSRYVLLAPDASQQLVEQGELEVFEFEQTEEGRQVARVRQVEGDPELPVEAALAIHPLDLRAARAAAGLPIGERLAVAFGNTARGIAILIALAAVIGKCLLDSGAADRIVRSALKVVGEPGAPLAFVGSGFLLGIPVFFDTVFYLMMPLGKAMRMRTGRNYLLYVLTIVAGASMAHSLVPPTPGPLLVAEELGIDLGLMIVGGCTVGMFSSFAAYLFARFANRRWEVPLRESPELSLKDLRELADRSDAQLPPLGLALLPIILPVLLIAGNTLLEEFDWATAGGAWREWMQLLGNKNIALGLATAVAIAMLVRQKRTHLRNLADSLQAALASGGVIILITAAGGAFGSMIQQTGVAGLIRELPPYSPLVILTLAFLITTAIRSAQGSATVAMITAVGVLASFAREGQLGCHPLYLGLAIGCGSKPIAWMNDSGFWVICKMSGMTEAEGLKFVTPMSILMGLAGLLATLAAAWLFPLQ